MSISFFWGCAGSRMAGKPRDPPCTALPPPLGLRQCGAGSLFGRGGSVGSVVGSTLSWSYVGGTRLRLTLPPILFFFFFFFRHRSATPLPLSGSGIGLFWTGDAPLFFCPPASCKTDGVSPRPPLLAMYVCMSVCLSLCPSSFFCVFLCLGSV